MQTVCEVRHWVFTPNGSGGFTAERTLLECIAFQCRWNRQLAKYVPEV